jgi:hypothetical protein
MNKYKSKDEKQSEGFMKMIWVQKYEYGICC